MGFNSGFKGLMSRKYYSCDQTARVGWTIHVARIWKRRSAYRALMRKLAGKRPLGKPKLIWEDDIKMDLQ